MYFNLLLTDLKFWRGLSHVQGTNMHSMFCYRDSRGSLDKCLISMCTFFNLSVTQGTTIEASYLYMYCCKFMNSGLREVKSPIPV